ncbi:phosphoribosylamine--glycine ligase [Candidatus Saccharibacteria bacterium]|nr:phosphoribosylamine--glycine ligase [Candidatus Saccharibacteria bacterium]
MKVLVIGGGAREHALGWKLAQSTKVQSLFFCPGNAGTAEIGTNISIDMMDNNKLVKFALSNLINLTIVGPDDVLASGIVDVFRDAQLKIFGPDKFATQIESSKAFSKKMMKKLDIPTAKFATFADYDSALRYCEGHDLPVVIKASGLAKGKGVVICHSRNDIQKALRSMMIDKIFGEAGCRVVIEEFLVGYELSVHALSDGKDVVMFPISQDNKPILDDDKGPNTGGMGSVAPVEILDQEQMKFVQKRIIQPVIDEFRRLEHPFIGCLYPGLMVTPKGIQVIEFNARFGDPECQSYMRLLESDLFELIESCTSGNLSTQVVRWSEKKAICVVMASGGYPGDYRMNKEVVGLDTTVRSDIIVFQAGTKKSQGKVVTNGGRVLSITVTGEEVSMARERAYAVIGKIKFNGMHYRTDIGLLKKSMTNF